MSYPIILKKCISPVNAVTKTFTGSPLTCDVVMKEDTDVFRPTFTIQTSDRLWDYNYIDGSSFSGRQYFITDIRSIGNNRFEVDAKTDVLSTWSNEIKSNTAVIARQQNRYNTYLNDPEWKVYAYEDVVAYKFTSPFSKDLKFLLAVAGS